MTWFCCKSTRKHVCPFWCIQSQRQFDLVMTFNQNRISAMFIFNRTQVIDIFITFFTQRLLD